jgi:hypothetical protein
MQPNSWRVEFLPYITSSHPQWEGTVSEGQADRRAALNRARHLIAEELVETITVQHGVTIIWKWDASLGVIP